MARKPTRSKDIADLVHGEATRRNIPTVEHQPVMEKSEQAPVEVRYPRGGQGLEEEKAARNPDLDPQLVWRGKDRRDWSDPGSEAGASLVVSAPPLYIQEKVKPKALIDDLRRMSEKARPRGETLDLFSDFNGLPEGADKTDFYQHEGHWQNRFILGDSLQVMASLAEREGLRGKVQCIYLDPPYGIKFNSNFQWSTTSRDVKDGKPDHITREPEQVKAFRDTWRDGIHSYLTYLRDRLTVARDLLSESGSIFVQIGDENVHRVRAVMDEVFGAANFISLITTKKSGGMGQAFIDNISDYVVWFGKDTSQTKYRNLFVSKNLREGAGERYRSVQEESLSIRPLSKSELRGDAPLPTGARIFLGGPLTSETASNSTIFPFDLDGMSIHLKKGGWKTNSGGMARLIRAGRLLKTREFANYKIFFDDFAAVTLPNLWEDTMGTAEQNKVYVVQTTSKVIQRCILMATDPGDLVLDPTCGSGTTAYVAEQWGRRWITIDTSRVALALARARLMGARYPYYLLADSREGQLKDAELTRSAPSSQPTFGNIAHGFVYERVPHITLKAIANNAEIDVIWEKFEAGLAPLREALTALLPAGWLADYRKARKYTAEVPAAIQEWEVPREPPADWSAEAKELVTRFWEQRIARQREIDASIAAKAEFEYLYDKPHEDRKTVRVAGPFTVESLSPHRVLGVDPDGELIDEVADAQAEYGRDFNDLILETLKVAGVQQAHKADRIEFSSLEPWPGAGYVCAVGTYLEGETPRRAAVFIGPEFGTVSRPDLVAAAREAADADFDVLISCAFSYDAHATELDRVGRIRVLKARMNADLHMAEDLKNTGKGNLFVIFGEPDVEILGERGEDLLRREGARETVQVPPGEEIRVRIRGVDVFHPNTGEVRSDGPEGIACWFIDTDYDEESFFVRHAYFLGANDPYKSLRTSLKAEIDEAAWASLHSATSRPFPKPATGRFAVKVINHLGDEVMKVFRVE